MITTTISQLLLIQYGPNLRARFLDKKEERKKIEKNKNNNNIAADFDKTLMLGYWDQQ